jgi:hypothetical protein
VRAISDMQALFSMHPPPSSHSLPECISPRARTHTLTHVQDSALIMDTWPETEPLWAPLHLLFRALQGLDTQTSAPRGLLLLQV